MILLTHLPVLEPKVAARLINGIPNLLRFAYVGVDIFFVLSGFLISRILIAEKTNGQLSFKRFYFKRALRVFPAYYVCLALTALLLSSDQLLPVIFYYNNYYSPFHNENPPLSHTWTLAVEEHFYLVWPMLIYFLPLKKARKVISFVIPAIAFVSGAAWFIFFNEGTAADLLYKSTNTRVLTLALGSYIAFREKEILTIKRTPLIVGSLIAIAFYTCCIVLVPGQPAGVRSWMHFLLIAPVSLIAVVISIRLDETVAIIKKLFTNGIIMFVGRISYGLYLYHLPVYYLLEVMPPKTYTPINKALVALACTFVVATISYYLMERQFLRLKDKLNAAGNVSR